MASGQKKRRDVEPITAICVAVFLMASVAVLAGFVNDNYISDSDGKVIVEPGSKVTVDYTGSLYAHYNEDGALIFDTNVKSYSQNNPTIGNFSRTSFSAFDVNVGSGGALAMFENALIGHKVGDTVKVTIPAANGYPSASIDRSNQFTVQTVQLMPQAMFTSLYGMTINAGVFVDFTTIYGWEATAVYSVDKGSVCIINKPVLDKTYDLKSNDLNKYGKATLKVDSIEVDSITNIEMISSKLVVEGVDGNSYKMVWVDLGSEKFYVQSDYIDPDTSTPKFKITSNPAAGEDLFFVIKIKTIA